MMQWKQKTIHRARLEKRHLVDIILNFIKRNSRLRLIAFRLCGWNIRRELTVSFVLFINHTMKSAPH